MFQSSRRILILPLLALGVLTVGCAPETSPVASDPAAGDGAVYLALAPGGLRPVGKPAAIPAAGVSASRTFGPGRGGSIVVEDLGGRGVRDDLRVEFRVGPRDLTQTATITMTVYGNTLSDLILAFEPSGLVFAEPAEIRVTIGAQRVDRSLLDLVGLLLPFSGLEADHTSEGETEPARITSVQTYIRLLFADLPTLDLLLYDYAVICVEVPGFSRYGLRR